MTTESNPLNLPSRFIVKIGLFGTVSVGKTTFLNALFAEHLSESKRKKCTLCPQVYMELDESNKKDIKLIRANNKLRNKEILEVLESNPNSFTIDVCKPIYYEVDRLYRFFDKRKVDKNIYLEIYDLPGLDDSMSNNVYIEWVNRNFHLFDIVIFITDIYKALNQISEITILRTIFTNIKKESNKFVHFIPIINKCDTFQTNDNGDLLIQSDEEENEDKEMFDQANSILYNIAKEFELESKIITTFIPFSAENAFIFRLLAKNPDEELDKHLTDKLGINEYGSNKWKRMNKIVRADAIKEIVKSLKKPSDYEEYMKQTGFIHLKNQIEEIIIKHKEKFLFNNIINDARLIKSIEDNADFNLFKITAINLIDKSKSMLEKFGLDSSQIVYRILNKFLEQHFNSKFEISKPDTPKEFYPFETFIDMVAKLIILKTQLVSFCDLIVKQYDRDTLNKEFSTILGYYVTVKNKISDLSEDAILNYNLNFESFHSYHYLIQLFDNVAKGNQSKLKDIATQFIYRFCSTNSFKKLMLYNEYSLIISYIIGLNVVPVKVLLDLIHIKIQCIYFQGSNTDNQLERHIYLVNLKSILKNKKSNDIETNNMLIQLKESIKSMLYQYYSCSVLFLRDDNGECIEITYNDCNLDFEKNIIDLIK